MSLHAQQRLLREASASTAPEFTLRALAQGVTEATWSLRPESRSPLAQLVLADAHRAPSRWCQLADVLIEEARPDITSPASEGWHLLARFPWCQLVVTAHAGNRFEVLRPTGQRTRVTLEGDRAQAALLCALVSGYVYFSPQQPPQGTITTLARNALPRWHSR